MTPRERAWFGIHDLLPHGWRVGLGARHPITGRWTITARSPRHGGRLTAPATIRGEGEDELAALTELSIRLRALRDIEKRMAIEERARAAYLQGAEEHSRATLGRPLTQDELRRIVDQYR